LAILKQKLSDGGIPCTVRHQNLFLLQYLKVDSYQAIGDRWGVNDFLFTANLQDTPVAQEQLDVVAALARKKYGSANRDFRTPQDPAELIKYYLKIRNEVVPAFLAAALEVVDEHDPTMVGFTCMFDQTFPSLALAKMIKQKHPEKLIVFGGYALEGEVGVQIIESFPFVDVVVFGEGEEKIVPLAEASVDRDSLSAIPGLIYRTPSGELRRSEAQDRTIDLDTSPYPDYDDFLSDVAELQRDHDVDVNVFKLPVESSRGCWWGQVSHCSFCGIDDVTMRYRYKSPERVLDMLDVMRRRYGAKLLAFSDYILPRQYYRTVLPRLAQRSEKYALHWEMKANVSYDEVRLMREAGIVSVQPGIESFSTRVLHQMRKGISGIRNIFTIKTLMENEISVYYNIIFGFPGDEPASYEQMIALIPSLYHLAPPYSTIPVQITRFAPLQNDPDAFGISGASAPELAYGSIFSKAFSDRIGFDARNYAYVFETPYQFSADCENLYRILEYQILHWTKLADDRIVQLSYEFTDAGVKFVDTRYQATPQLREFGRSHREVFAAIGPRLATRKRLAQDCADRLGEDELAAVLDDFRKARLVCEEGEHIISLAFPASFYENQLAAIENMRELETA
jgi:ribosomal peptide maturation radical SAM protein 1